MGSPRPFSDAEAKAGGQALPNWGPRDYTPNSPTSPLSSFRKETGAGLVPTRYRRGCYRQAICEGPLFPG